MRKLKLLGLFVEVAIGLFLITLLLPSPGIPQGYYRGYKPAASISDMLQPAIVTPPVASAFTWLNQGAATATQIPGGSVVLAAVGTGGDSIHMLQKTYPSTPADMVVGYSASVTATEASTGIAIYDGSAKLVYFCLNVNADLGGTSAYVLAVNYFTNATTYSGSGIAARKLLTTAPSIYLKIHDDGTTNFTFYYSLNGGNTYVTLGTLSRTAFISAFGTVGPAVDPYFGSGTPLVEMNIVHWSGA